MEKDLDESPPLFLILHKVRGQPAFDIAHQLEIGGEIGWIIPTSGHRAYPFHKWNLEDLADISDINNRGFHNYPAHMDYMKEDFGNPWANHPDHYPHASAASEDKTPIRNILALVGIKPKPFRLKP